MAQARLTHLVKELGQERGESVKRKEKKAGRNRKLISLYFSNQMVNGTGFFALSEGTTKMERKNERLAGWSKEEQPWKRKNVWPIVLFTASGANDAPSSLGKEQEH